MGMERSGDLAAPRMMCRNPARTQSCSLISLTFAHRSRRLVSRAIADTSVFVAREVGRPLGDLPDEIAVSVVTAAELELGVLRASDPGARATRLRTLSRVRVEYPLLGIDDATTSCFARIADEELRAGRKPRRRDVWIPKAPR
jgi:predicted nucleic acid-binding protein